ncbi:MAG: CehA/McbA family metallohydrolase, partial [Planctomycetes bacterium]|nr:CehA/McbA family metallohydrolase [Planctomycetota bacterium]
VLFRSGKADDLNSSPIPFDIVRFHSSNGATSAWASIASQLPFNENYRYPVFCFGLLATADLKWDRYADAEIDLGVLEYSGPERMRVGGFYGFHFEYTVGENGFPPGAGLKFNLSNEVIECNRRSRRKRPLPEKDWSPLQWDNPRAPGYLEVECSRPETEISLECEDHFSKKVMLKEGTPLQPGDTITLRVGEHPNCPGIRTQLLAQMACPFKFFFDLAGNGVYLSSGERHCVDVVGGDAGRLLVHCPPTPDAGEEIRVVVTAIDHLGNVAHEYTGEVCLFADAEDCELPSVCYFSEDEEGSISLTARIGEEGVFQIHARDQNDPSVSGSSNLIVTDGSFGPGKLYFGDIHTHSQLSDGRLHPEHKAIEVSCHRGLDFWALTDHGHDFTEERLAQLNSTLEKHNEPGRFVTIPGYEWTNSMGRGEHMREKYGHRNIYSRTPFDVIYDGVSPASDTPGGVYQSYEKSGRDFFCINHFHCGDPEMWPGVDGGVEVSGWCGEFLRDGLHGENQKQPWSIFDAFDDGLDVGVTAGTDHGTEAYYAFLPAEMTAVQCDELTRDAVYDALKEGRTYATSGQKTLLRFTVNGQSPGGKNDALTASERQLEITVGSVMPIQRIEVIKNGEMWQTISGHRFGVEKHQIQDSESGSGYYLVRVLTAQGHTTWSSPIFFG